MPNHREDPIERIIATTLDDLGVSYSVENNEQRLDFYLPDQAIYIEVKQFYSERTIRQMQDREDVILIQGRVAALGFRDLIIEAKMH